MLMKFSIHKRRRGQTKVILKKNADFSQNPKVKWQQISEDRVPPFSKCRVNNHRSLRWKMTSLCLDHELTYDSTKKKKRWYFYSMCVCVYLLRSTVIYLLSIGDECQEIDIEKWSSESINLIRDYRQTTCSSMNNLGDHSIISLMHY